MTKKEERAFPSIDLWIPTQTSTQESNKGRYQTSSLFSSMSANARTSNSEVPRALCDGGKDGVTDKSAELNTILRGIARPHSTDITVTNPVEVINKVNPGIISLVLMEFQLRSEIARKYICCSKENKWWMISRWQNLSCTSVSWFLVLPLGGAFGNWAVGLNELLAVVSPDPVLSRKQLCSFLPVVLEKQNFFHIFHKNRIGRWIVVTLSTLVTRVHRLRVCKNSVTCASVSFWAEFSSQIRHWNSTNPPCTILQKNTP